MSHRVLMCRRHYSRSTPVLPFPAASVTSAVRERSCGRVTEMTCEMAHVRTCAVAGMTVLEPTAWSTAVGRIDHPHRAMGGIAAGRWSGSCSRERGMGVTRTCQIPRHQDSHQDNRRNASRWVCRGRESMHRTCAHSDGTRRVHRPCHAAHRWQSRGSM